MITGRGIDFPFTFDSVTGGVRDTVTNNNFERIRQSIAMILTTARGERFFRPEYGSRLKMFLFDPITPATADQIKFDLFKSIRENEPRVEVLEIGIRPNDEETGFIIGIYVKERDTGLTYDFTFPVVPYSTASMTLPSTHSTRSGWR